MSHALRGRAAAVGFGLLGFAGIAGWAEVASAQLAPPSQDLVVWLRADAGVETDAGSGVAAWRDQATAGSGAGRQNALGTLAGQRPTLVNSALAGRPAVRFVEGDSDQLLMDDNTGVADPSGDDAATDVDLSNLFTSAARVFIVASPNDNQYSLYRTRENDSYFRFGDSNGYLGVFRTSRIEQYPSGGEGGGNPTSGDHVWEIVSDASTYQAFIDTVARTPQGAQFNGGEGHAIGIGNFVGPYNGDISEILIYNSGSDVNRAAVYSYLNAKYGVVPEPAALSLLALGGLVVMGRRRR
jgi:hypothetical protein